MSSELNTKFYYISIVIRQCQNQILQLKSECNGWISGRNAIGRELVRFSKHYSHPIILLYQMTLRT